MYLGSLHRIQVKICGMRDAALCRLAVELGADFIGMIHHPASPRHLELSEMTQLCQDFSACNRVAVVVQPSDELLIQLWETGVDGVQVHLKNWETEVLERFASHTPSGKELWIAPKLAPGVVFPEKLFRYGNRFLLDTYSPDMDGGTGITGDWLAFRKLRERYPEERFILAGGIGASNVEDAIRESQTAMIDVSSALEETLGFKSEETIRSFFETLNRIAL